MSTRQLLGYVADELTERGGSLRAGEAQLLWLDTKVASTKRSIKSRD
jgi:hypothetical protein